MLAGWLAGPQQVGEAPQGMLTRPGRSMYLRAATATIRRRHGRAALSQTGLAVQAPAGAFPEADP